MESKEKNTKEKILEEALKLFAQSGYMGTSMNDIASKLGVTKAALYKHYKIKQEILDSIIEKMKELDIERAKQYEMPEGDLEKVTAEYKEMAFDKIKQFTKVQFLHWTEEEFSSCFRKMLTLEQYREPQMAQLYQNYLASGPLTYMEALFSGMLGDAGKASQTALDFYGPIFLLYSIYDGAEDRVKRNESNHIYIKYRKHSRVCTINGKGIESSSTQLKEVRDKNTIPQRIPLFTLQGNFDVKKLRGTYRFMMNVMVKTAGKGLANKPDRTPEEDDMLDMMVNGGKRVSLQNLKTVTEWYISLN